MVGSALTKTVAYGVESSLASGTADYDATGTIIHVTEINLDNLMQGVIENQNIKQRVTGTRAPILGLKASGFSFGMYFCGSETNAAEGAQATVTHISPLLKNALGGQIAGYSAGLAGGSTTAPTVETGEGSANFGDYWFGFFYDASAGKGYFRQIASWSTDTATVASGHALPFTPDGGGADRIYAAVVHYPDQDALVSYSDANHTTLSFFVKGAPGDNNYEIDGVKLSAELAGLEQGSLAMLNFEGQCVTFANENLTPPDLDSTPEGTAGHVIGSGTDTVYSWAATGVALASFEAWSVAPQVGIKYQPVNGPNGQEGVHGFTGTGYDDTMVTVTVPYSDDYAAEFRAGTERHLMVQIGTATTRSCFVYFPRLAYAKNPALGVSADLSSITLEFRALERELDVSGMDADDAELAQAKIVLGYVA